MADVCRQGEHAAGGDIGRRADHASRGAADVNRLVNDARGDLDRSLNEGAAQELNLALKTKLWAVELVHGAEALSHIERGQRRPGRAQGCFDIRQVNAFLQIEVLVADQEIKPGARAAGELAAQV